MPTPIVLDPAEVATGRSALELNAGPIRVAQAGPDFGDAAIEAAMADAARGSLPVDYRIPNRVMQVPLVLGADGRASFEDARRQLQAKVALFQREGGWLRIGDAGALAVYLDVVNASLKLPARLAHLGVEGEVLLTLECIPDFYGPEITLAATGNQTGELVFTAPSTIKGDYPGRVRLAVTEKSGQAQSGLLWGFRSRYYSNAATARLVYEAEALTRLDTAALATVTGASGGGSNNVVQHNNLAASWTPVLSTKIISGSAEMTHVGTYRVWARVRSTSTTPPRVRLVWGVGALTNPTTNPPKQIPGASAFYLLDLGEIRLDPSPAGAHRWLGVIQAAGTDGGENVQIDKLHLQPAGEGCGTFRASQSLEVPPTGHLARDEFNQTPGALVGKTAPVGGPWQGAGSSTDFQVGNFYRNHVISRTVNDGAAAWPGRFATLAGALNVAVRVQVEIAGTGPMNGLKQAAVARYTDTNNWIALLWSYETGKAELVKRVAGTATTMWSVDLPSSWLLERKYLMLAVTTGGSWSTWVYLRGATPGAPIGRGDDSALATGGALNGTRVGVYDQATGGVTGSREMTNFAAWTPDAEAVIHPNRICELRTDGIVRQDAAGAAYGPVAVTTGPLPRALPAGLENRPLEAFVKGSRGDLDQLPDSGLDALSGQLLYRPSWIQFPWG